jgi:hypothetical protein
VATQIIAPVKVQQRLDKLVREAMGIKPWTMTSKIYLLPRNKAGIGLGLASTYMGTRNSRNTAKPLQGEMQPNNRAEITVAIGVMKERRAHGSVEICTDSEYSVKGATEWLEAWKRRG